MTILFFLRRRRADRLGKVPIYFRITVNGKRLEPPRNTGVKVAINKWANQRVKGSAPENLILDTIEHRIKTIHASQIARGKIPSLQSVINEYDGKAQLNLFDLAEEFFKYELENFVNNKRLSKEEQKCEKTIDNYRFKFEHIRRYYAKTSNEAPTAEQMDAFELSKIVEWLRVESDIILQRSTISRIVSVVRKVIAYGYKKRYLDTNPVKDFEYSRKGYNEPISLSLTQVKQLLNHIFPPNLYDVSCVFLLQCYTGMEFKDILFFSDKNIITVDGMEYISYKRQKNGNTATIPLNDELCVVLKRYAFKTPQYSLDTYNVKLKRITDRVGLDVDLTMRVGRKTFYNMQLNENCYSFEAVAAMMGHKKVGTGKHYGYAKPELVYNETKNKYKKAN